MKFILICGPQAVGKMTVGKSLAELTNFKLFHNHMTIDLLQPIFGFSQEMWKLSSHFRQEIFKASIESDIKGLIFTYVWAFDQEDDWEYVNKICKLFEERGVPVFFVELQASFEERLKRNIHPSRLEVKLLKKDINSSEKNLLESMQKYRLNSYEGEITNQNYLKIDNTNKTPDEVAQEIKQKFNL